VGDYDVSATPASSVLHGQVAVVTGAGQGIGRALVDALVQEEVGAVVAFDRDVDALTALADTMQGPTRVVAHRGDVTVPGEIEQLVQQTEREFGRVDMFCSNAGVMTAGGAEVPDALWQRSWDVNVMAHVHAARAVLPGMVARARGVLLNVLSAASFLSAPESAPYTVTKHAALGFAEWVAINFGHQGIQVCAVCPEAVDTQMLQDSLARSGGGPSNVGSRNGVLSPRQVADAAVLAVKAEQFLATTHPHTLRHVQRKWTDIDKWIRAMSVLIEKGD
jgi:NAD(P)-dependent dehydrogenase (short-subunit alcohol dehydrogenase family)